MAQSRGSNVEAAEQALPREPHSGGELPIAVMAAPRPWRPTTLLLVSAAIHAGALGSLLVAPSNWATALGALFLNHSVLAWAGLWPRSAALGSNWRRLPPQAANRREVALTIDDGPDPFVTPQVLDILDRYNAKATFFCIGERASEYGELCREMVRRGHAVENHTQRHLHRFATLGPGAIDKEIRIAQETCTGITGQSPSFFRPPAGLRNPFLDPILARYNLQLVSWTRRGFDTRERCPATVTRRLLDGLSAGDILLLHDGNAARIKNGEPIILHVLPQLLEALARENLRSVTLRAALM